MSDLNLEIEGARCYCDLVQVDWPYKEDVLWLKLKTNKGWKVTAGGSATTVVSNKELALVLSQTFFLTSLKQKLLELGLKHFNVCQSVPKSDGLTNIENWTGPHDPVKKLWISSEGGDKSAVEQLINQIFDLWRDESLIVFGFPMVLDFCINVLYVIGHLFTKVGLVNPRGPYTILIFHKFHNLSLLDSKLLHSISDMANDKHLADLSIAPQSDFYESAFYKCCVHISCRLLKEQVLDILLNIDAAKKSMERIGGKVEPERNQELEKLNGNSMDVHCHLENCTYCTGSEGFLSCGRMKDELMQLLKFVQEIDIKWPAEEENVIWLDFSGQASPNLQIVKKKCIYSVFLLEEVSKFCAKQLLQCQRRLSHIFIKGSNFTKKDIQKGSCLQLDMKDDIATCLKSYRWSECPLEVKVLDFGRELWLSIEDHVSYQNDVLLRILNALDDTWRNECLELRGFPLLSEFNVSIVFVLGHFFEKVGLLHPNSWKNVIFFSNFTFCPREVKRYLQEALLENEVLSLVPLKNIFCGEFYECIRASNNLNLKKQCLKILQCCSLGENE